MKLVVSDPESRQSDKTVSQWSVHIAEFAIA